MLKTAKSVISAGKVMATVIWDVDIIFIDYITKGKQSMGVLWKFIATSER